MEKKIVSSSGHVRSTSVVRSLGPTINTGLGFQIEEQIDGDDRVYLLKILYSSYVDSEISLSLDISGCCLGTIDKMIENLQKLKSDFQEHLLKVKQDSEKEQSEVLAK